VRTSRRTATARPAMAAAARANVPAMIRTKRPHFPMPLLSQDEIPKTERTYAEIGDDMEPDPLAD
jgi:hypothetical protein